MSRRMAGLLMTESEKDFARRRKGLAARIRPIGPVEDEYADDFAHCSWEADRFRRIGTALLNTALVQALENLLQQLLPPEDFNTPLERDHAAHDLARRWPGDREVRAFVSKLLRKCQLDEAAIEAEAFRLCAPDLEAVHRIVAFKQARRDRDLCVLGEIRQGLLDCLQPDGAPEEEVPRLVAVGKRGS
jgi:hypothetical protein